LLLWGLIAEPVVVPGVLFDLVASVVALASFDAPGAGWICADAAAVAPNHAATTRVEIASLERMAISSDQGDAGARTCHADLGSGRARLFTRQSRRLLPAARDAFNANRYYLLSLFLSLFLVASRLPEWWLMPVVVPDFVLLVFIFCDFVVEVVAPGPTLPSLDAPGAGCCCVCADAIAVAPKSEAITRAEIASLDRMRNLLIWMDKTGDRTCEPNLSSRPGAGFSPAPGPDPRSVMVTLKRKHRKDAVAEMC
jgi:hypothetical protein